MKALFILALTLLPVGAVANPAVLPSVAPQIDQIAGVYKTRFKNGTVAGETYMSEDILEVVKVTPNTAYFRIHSEFYNGHTCSLWGIADLEPHALVFRQTDDNQPCELRFTVNKQGIILNDVNEGCRAFSCGNRGAFDNGTHVDYPFTTRRPIRYMARLLASREYAEAMNAHRDEHARRRRQ
ncbi:hypothetical protein [Caulobacter sp. FWC2]|uniref:hypothetical protein n=1 Tax=Caulobacter sp. FWC2 TaxID=69664 RepID=UPI000C149451|nr:hypothetical protein [Caulobacter sp. FWC2]PIB94059.1 hypothetical protein CSW62_22275 [Caulobacter sp. FWC2]